MQLPAWFKCCLR